MAIEDLSDDYHLGLDLTDENDVLLIGNQFAVSITIDSKAVRLSYYDARSAPGLHGYAMGEDAELKAVVEELERSAPEVLSGSCDWMAGYSGEISNVQGAYRERILNKISRWNVRKRA